MLALCYHKTIEKNHRAFGNLPPLPYLWSLGIYISCTFLIKKKKVYVLLNTTATKPKCEPILKCNYSISRGKPLQRFPALQVTFKAQPS